MDVRTSQLQHVVTHNHFGACSAPLLWGPSMPCCSSSTCADSTRPFPSSIDLPCVNLIGTSHQGWLWAIDDDTICEWHALGRHVLDCFSLGALVMSKCFALSVWIRLWIKLARQATSACLLRMTTLVVAHNSAHVH